MGRAHSTNEEKMEVCRILVGKTDGSNLEKPRRNCMDNIAIDLRFDSYGMNLSGPVYGPVEGSCERCIEPSIFIKYVEFLE
jgi:hypothetical protein